MPRAWLSVANVCLIVAALQVCAQAETLKTGDPAPKFEAVGVDGTTYTQKTLDGAKATVVCFTSTKCPVARAYEARIGEFVRSFRERGVKVIAINVNHNENLDLMKTHATDSAIDYPYTFDASGKSARAFGAKATPHFFVVDAAGKVVFQGPFDNNWAQNPTKRYVQDAVEAVLAGKTPDVTVVRPVGCQIKLPRN